MIKTEMQKFVEAQREGSHKIGDFLGWLISDGLCNVVDSYTGQPLRDPVGELVFRYYSIDRNRYEAEVRATLLNDPIPGYHVVKSGENLSMIAHWCRVTVEELIQWNPDQVEMATGQPVIYPGTALRVKPKCEN